MPKLVSFYCTTERIMPSKLNHQAVQYNTKERNMKMHCFILHSQPDNILIKASSESPLGFIAKITGGELRLHAHAGYLGAQC